jgi:8-amino-7-oxononanoate synthase
VRRRRGLGGHPLIEEARSARQTLAALTARGVANPNFVPHHGISRPTIDMLGRELVNLENRLAGAYGVDDAVITTSGYLANAAVIAFLLTSTDLAICDTLVHSSIVAGTQWAPRRRVISRHNDPDEGAYSMNGDIVALPEVLSVAREFDCLVMVDEAHSFGTVGSTVGVCAGITGYPAMR